MPQSLSTAEVEQYVSRGVKREHAVHIAHWRHHSKEFDVFPEDRCLECEVCCGVPPWQWQDFKTHVYASAEDPRKILYTAFGWRNDRVWKKLRYPMGSCRVCGKFARVARHRTDPQRRFYSDENDICLKCARKENRPLSGLTDSQFMREIVKKIREANPRRNK